MNKSRKPNSVLMVCVDNTCSSPIAEAVMRNTIAKARLQNDWRVDSAGIESWSLGDKPDPRALSVLSKHCILYKKCARRITANDFEKFDYIFGMDLSVMASLRLLMPHHSKAKLLLLSDFLFGLKPCDRGIDDPYYDLGEENFEKIYKQCVQASLNFLTQARQNEIIT